MLIYDYYGTEKDESEAATVFIRDGWAGPADAELEAVLYSAQEYIISLSPLVIDEQGNALNWPSIKVAHSNPAIKSISQGGTGVQLDGAMTELFPTNVANNRGIQLGSGSKIGPGGPVDLVWITGKLSGKRIRSERVKVGLYSTDVVLSPVYLLRAIGGGSPVTPPPSGGTDGHALIQAGIAEIQSGLLKVREGEFKLG